jgi:hypothetical protein
MNGWQPIATAPKDGARILVWGPETARGVTVARWGQPEPSQLWGDRRCWTTDDEGPGYSDCVEATHWMPLPAGP